MILETGTQIGDYKILSRIANGAYGVVYEAEHTITRRVDALKVMHCAYAADDEQRFVREIQVQAKLQHPNIATVYTAFRTPHGLVLVMERVRGESLRAILERGRIPFRIGLQYVLDTLAALECAEQLGVVHRDIKPENILITPEGAVKLTDFGLAHILNTARITSSGETVGTPMYMAPEQIEGAGEVDARTDVYATGVVLYEVATGRPPFPGTSGFAVMRAHRETQPVPPRQIDPAIASRLNSVILKALEKDPNQRFQSAADFRGALEEVVASAQTAREPARWKLPRRRAAVLAGWGLCAGAILAGYWAFPDRGAGKGSSRAVRQAPAVTAAPAPAKPTPPAVETPASVAAAETELPASEAAVESQAAPRATPANRKRQRSRAAPRSTLPRFTGGEPVHAVEPPLPKQQERAPATVAEIPVTKEATLPAATETTAKSTEEPLKAVPENAEPKKRNVVLRTFGKIFGRKPAPAACPAVAPGAKK